MIAQILTIAGSDCSGGAGIQADIKAISALGGYAASAITAITAQNTLGVNGISPISSDMVSSQIRAVLDDLDIRAIKIGMVFSADIVHAIADTLSQYQRQKAGAQIPIVFDPVMISTSGHRLMSEDTIAALCQKLFPISTLLTPNLHEASHLMETEIRTVAQMEEMGQALEEKYGVSVLVKGGHLDGDDMVDVLCHEGRCYHYTHPRVDSRNLHGTGCTLSSAIATFLGQGQPLPEAVRLGSDYVHKAICKAAGIKIGQGNGPLWHFV